MPDCPIRCSCGLMFYDGREAVRAIEHAVKCRHQLDCRNIPPELELEAKKADEVLPGLGDLIREGKLTPDRPARRHAIDTLDGGNHYCSCGRRFPVGDADAAYRHASEANATADQPPPVATDRRPCWDIVIDLAAKMRGKDGYGRLHDVVLEDMRRRDSEGRAKYGVPLTAGNGRNYLVDAYQEYLDGAVYLAAWLDEKGVAAETLVNSSDRPDAWTISCVQQMLYDQLRDIVRLRAFIDSEAKAAVDALSARP